VLFRPHRVRPHRVTASRGSRTVATAVAAATVAAFLIPAGISATTASSAAADIDAPPTFEPISSSPAERAERALEVAEEVMAGESDAVSPTLALRDLALGEAALTGDDREAAETLLARPNEGTRGGDGFAAWSGREAAASRNDRGCSADPQTPVCVRWTNKGRHAPPRVDSDNNGVPNWVEVTLTEMENVWAYQVETLGYRPPLTDERGSKDNDGVYFDVYLSDIGNRYYGYCAVDDTRTVNNYDFGDRSGYCVLDDDYARSQFSAHTPRENLQVTAAHEFFHAIQFGYDAREDGWFMEGGAAWIEDEVYDDVNDNRMYLRYSQFNRPLRPLDTRSGLAIYGSWGFLRYLTDQVDSDVVKLAWEYADGAPGGPDDYSLVALRKAMQDNGAPFTKTLGDFGLALHEPEAFVSEGAGFPSASVDTFELNRRGDSTRWRRYVLDHLAYAPITLRPGDRLRAGDQVRITVDAPAIATHPQARAMVVFRNGTYGSPRSIDLNDRGNGALTLPFGAADIKRVVVSLGNVSADFRRCYDRLTQYSCRGGVPAHEDQRFWVKAVVR
jgi:hypothetical protein